MNSLILAIILVAIVPVATVEVQVHVTAIAVVPVAAVEVQVHARSLSVFCYGRCCRKAEEGAGNPEVLGPMHDQK